MTQTGTMLAAATEYAQRGWYVFPLHTPRPDVRCSCRKATCQNIGKHPRTEHGVSDATIDPDRIATWWGMWPDANIGIACGPSGLVVIDIDPRHGGDESLADMKKKHGRDTFQTVSSHTGGGGEHYIYAQPAGIPIGNVSSSEKFTGPLGPGVDVRAAGGYIVAPPSLHASGTFYEWYEGESPTDREPQRLPLPLIDALETRSPDRSDAPPVSASAILAGVPEGNRDWSLFQLASKLRYADVPIDWAFDLVEAAAAACTPPFDRTEARKKVVSAYNRYEAGKGAFVTQEEAEAALKHADGLAGREFIGSVMEHGPKPTNWLIEPLIVHGRIHMLYGEPESGKTIILLSFILQCVERGEHVLYIDEESGIDAVAGLLLAMGAKPAVIDEYVHYFPFPGIDTDAYPALLAYADMVQPAMVAFDSLTDMLTVANLDENSGNQVTTWMLDVATALARRDYAPSVVLIDHVPKDAENVRYSVASRAKKAKSDVLWFVRKLSDFDQERTAKVELERHKNRPGVLPKKTTYTIGGEDGRLICRPFDISRDAIEREHPMAAEFVRALQEGGPLGRSKIAKQLGVSDDTVYRVAKDLIYAGTVKTTGEGKSQRYSLTNASGGSTNASVGSELTHELTQNGPLIGPVASVRSSAAERHWWQDKESEEEGW